MISPNESNEIRIRYADYVRGEHFNSIFGELHPKPLVVFAIVFVLSITIVKIPLAFRVLRGGMVRGFATSSRRRAYGRLAERGVPLYAEVVMANELLHKGQCSSAPGLVLGSLDPARGANQDELGALALDILTNSLGGGSTHVEKALGRLGSQDDFRFGRRRPLPTDATKGREVWAFDLMLVASFLTGPNTMSRAWCIAEPNKGIIAMLPPNCIPESLH